MRKFAYLAAGIGGALTLSACGGGGDASRDASAETVEGPAEEALADVSDEPAEDANASEAVPSEEVEGPPPVTEEVATEAADNAETVASQATSALEAIEAAEAAAAAEAAEAASAIEAVVDTANDMRN